MKNYIPKQYLYRSICDKTTLNEGSTDSSYFIPILNWDKGTIFKE